MTTNDPVPGPIALFGSGETAPSGQKIYDFLFNLMSESARVSIIETPAGFELNSEQVASNVADFIKKHLQNYRPDIRLIPARKKGTSFSPDDPQINLPILESELIFMGPGSPSYAVRQLQDSLAWKYLLTRHRQGAALAFSSATTIAISADALPVYEIYKVGEDLHWKPGLDFFRPYQLPLVFIPHWNNKDGGKDLDTSRCYMGASRFNKLLTMLPEDRIVMGIDEHTGLIIDFDSGCLHVVGLGAVTILKEGTEGVISSGSSIDLQDLGKFTLCDPLDGISDEMWDMAQEIQKKNKSKNFPSSVITELAEKRETARKAKDWETADRIREQIKKKGWSIKDNSEGYTLEKNP